MPFVEVWVDEPECNGTCNKSHQMGKRRDCAFALIVAGKPNDAIDVLLRGDLPEDFTITKELHATYNAWTQGQLEGFDGPANPQNYHINNRSG